MNHGHPPGVCAQAHVAGGNRSGSYHLLGERHSWWVPAWDNELGDVKVGAALRRCGRAQKNRFETRSGKSSKTNKNERVNGGDDLPVISQDGVWLGPALHQLVLIKVKHVAKVLLPSRVTREGLLILCYQNVTHCQKDCHYQGCTLALYVAVYQFI